MSPVRRARWPPFLSASVRRQHSMRKGASRLKYSEHTVRLQLKYSQSWAGIQATSSKNTVSHHENTVTNTPCSSLTYPKHVMISPGEIRQQVQVQGGSQVVRVGDEHVLHPLGQELVQLSYKVGSCRCEGSLKLSMPHTMLYHISYRIRTGRCRGPRVREGTTPGRGWPATPRAAGSSCQSLAP